MTQPQPTGRNLGRYSGDTIDIDVLLAETVKAARRLGWTQRHYHRTPDQELFYVQRTFGQGQRRVYLSAGIHGDEPGGPGCVLELITRDRWPADAEVYLFPCLNPTGFRRNSRENADGIDLNRDYRRAKAPETRAHIEVLNQLPDFDLMICLHEDWEAEGFYLYELNPRNRHSPAEEVVRRVSDACPIDRSPVIDGRAAAQGVIRPEINPAQRDEWPESLYLIQGKTDWSYTLEAPSDFELPVRVNALTKAVDCLFDAL